MNKLIKSSLLLLLSLWVFLRIFNAYLLIIAITIIITIIIIIIIIIIIKIKTDPDYYSYFLKLSSFEIIFNNSLKFIKRNTSYLSSLCFKRVGKRLRGLFEMFYFWYCVIFFSHKFQFWQNDCELENFI